MSTILENVMRGEPIEAPFIDVHGHFGPWPETVIPHALDGQRVIAEMDRYGCDMVWMSASNPGYSGDISVKNDFVFDLAAKYPHRIIPYCTLSAHTPDRNVAELQRCLARGRCIGVKMHIYRQPPYTMESDWLQPVLEILADRRLVYLNHAFTDLDALCSAAEKYPDLTFMSGHWGYEPLKLSKTHSNITDCTCAANGYGSIADGVSKFGSRAMLVGSDFSLFQLGFGIGMIAYADIPEPDKENIAGRNALRLLKRVEWFDEIRWGKNIG